MPERDAAPIDAVEIYAPARLHLGFLDLDGGLGRRFGSLGSRHRRPRYAACACGAPQRRRRAAPGAGPRRPLSRPRPRRPARPAGGRALTVREASPAHAGFGSGTQLGLAVAAGARAAPRRRPPRRRAGARRSVAARGRASASAPSSAAASSSMAAAVARRRPAPVVARLPISRRHGALLLILDQARQGLSGRAESAAFAALPRFAEALAGALCRLLLMRLLPGFGRGRFRRGLGPLARDPAAARRLFRPAQGGRYRQRRAVAGALALLRAARDRRDRPELLGADRICPRCDVPGAGAQAARGRFGATAAPAALGLQRRRGAATAAPRSPAR